MIHYIKATLRNSRFTSKAYRALYSLYWNRQIKKKNRSLMNEGKDVIVFIQSLLNNYEGKVFFDMGTLLGFVREGKILSHDLDIDLGMLSSSEQEKENFRQYLISNGCQMTYQYIICGIGVVEDSFVYRNVKFDVNYYINCDNHSVCYLMYRQDNKRYQDDEFEVVKLEAPPINDIEKINVYGVDVNIPNNPEKYLECRYGEGWRIPDRGYIYYNGPSARRTDYVGARVIY